MNNLLDDLYAPVLNAATLDDFKIELIKFGKQLGFDLINADYATPRPNRAWISVNNFSKQWLDEQTVFEHKDPVIVAVDATPKPVLWDRDFFVKSGFANLAEVITKHGFKAGVEVPTYSPSGSELHLGFSRDGDLPSNPLELTRVVADAQLFAAFALPALDRLLTHTRDADFPRLTSKELEVMKWTAAGKTAFEVGTILGITERTANFHMQNICAKLGVINKRAAIAKAIQLRLVL